ncbi:queuosine precursor transporter [Sporolactobacillus spathodeae]|uniref:Probable queuosine precursor transporter n=1 Tax=Sporolactobacillus spathodeae TaxID=1465502 RepID=A0ABS2Q7D1_9BACL|nr:queuosine precursor transporter [Sporolactobacillus spathodeae]MBM7657693.1 putative integral membrane protein (TIGR00697 family) [Sporolactobacillus spathodeae]
MNSSQHGTAVSFKLLILAMVFSTCLIAANLVASKLFSVGGFFMTSGIIIYPLTFLVLDSITECWGKPVAQRIVWIGLFANVLFILLLQAAIHLPAAPFWKNEPAFATILGAMPRTVLASLCGYSLSQTLDIALFTGLKRRTHGKMLWLRSLLSTAISQLADSTVFMFVGFAGILPIPAILATIGTEYVLKFSYAVIGVPFIYLIVHWIRGRKTGVLQGESQLEGENAG